MNQLISIHSERRKNLGKLLHPSPLVLHARVVSGNGGGPDKTILNSPGWLEKNGYRAACAYLRDPRDTGFDAIRQRANERGADLLEIDDFGFFDWGIVKRTREIVEKHQPAIWHGHDYKSNLLGILLRKHHPMQLVTTVHGWVQRTWKTPLYYAIDRRCLPRYDQVICVSEDLYSDCARLGIAKDRLTLIDNAIDLTSYPTTRNRSAARQALGIPDDCQLLAGVGRLSEEKGFSLLIESVANLIDAGRDVSLMIAGDGAARRSLQELIEKRNCRNRIRLLGFVKDPRMVYQAADLFVSSSLREGLPNVVLEAMASRTPVLVTRIAGMPSLIKDGVNGRMIEPGSGAQLQSTIAELLDSPAALQAFATAGRVTVEEDFDFARRMENVAEVYDQRKQA